MWACAGLPGEPQGPCQLAVPLLNAFPFPPYPLNHSRHPSHPSLIPVQRFTFRPVDPKVSGQTHPSVIPVAPLNGMRMYVS